jgi:predicted nucleotidyltransferase
LAILIGIISIVAHEAGHALLARLCGWKCNFIIFLGFIITFHNGIQIKLASDKDKSLLGGAVAIAPPIGGILRPRHYVLILFGGALPNLILFTIFITPGLVFQNIDLLALSIMPLANVVACMLPIRFRFNSTDGRKIFNILKGGRVATEEILRIRIGGSLADGSIPELENSDLDILISSKDKTSQYFGYAYSILYAQKKGDADVSLHLKNEIKKLIKDDKHLQLLDYFQFRIGDKE